jgi:Flp pilus assembly protein TadG
VTVLAVLGLMVVLGAAALAVDLSMLMAARTQLAIAADAAALAGVKELPFGSRDRARTRAVEYAARNEVLGAPVTLELGQGGEGDVELGYYDFDHHSFQPEDLMPNAVRVTARRTGERAVPTFFAAVFGRRHVDVWTRAVAVSYPRTVVVTFDRSASMGKSGAIGPARNAAAEFLEGLALSTLPERMGLVAYASTAAALSPILGLHDPGQPGGLVTMARRIEAAPEGEEGGTNTGQAIERAIELFSEVKPGQGRDGGQRMIVLLSDGLANRGRRGQDCHTYQTQHGNVCWRYAVEAAAEAHAEGIVVHTITLGDAGQIQQMREIAEAGGHGLALFAPTPAELDEMFDTLARSAQVALVN